MKVAIAIDSFKGSISSLEAGRAVAEGVRAANTDAQTVVCPLADGGEGTVEALVSAMGGTLCRAWVTGPLGERVEAAYGVLSDTRTAIIEMSAAAGITLIPAERRDPRAASTYGVGELIAHAIKTNNCRRFIVGIGGSATNDGGVGMLQALGFSFRDADGREIPRGADGLKHLSQIDCGGALKELADCAFFVACDVTNPLCGAHGCSAVYGPQKGATPEMIAQMDADLARYAALSERVTGRAQADTPGAGAAGGMGFAFLTYLGARLESGIALVMRETHLEEAIKDADVVVTGEGRLDGQTVMGKAPVGVASLAKRYGKPVIAFAGCVTEDAGACNAHGIDAFFPILRTVCTLDDAMNAENAYRNLKNTAEQAFRLIRCMRGE
ncbi:MAG: glycerate kinase [Clostridia bacterium]|nr:glycerate kinase [Clostridia bacterium]